MKRPYFVEYSWDDEPTQWMPLDIEVGRLHGADIIVNKLIDALRDKLYAKGKSPKEIQLISVYKL